jgi:hypothetical protein
MLKISTRIYNDNLCKRFENPVVDLLIDLVFEPIKKAKWKGLS